MERPSPAPRGISLTEETIRAREAFDRLHASLNRAIQALSDLLQLLKEQLNEVPPTHSNDPLGTAADDRAELLLHRIQVTKKCLGQLADIKAIGENQGRNRHFFLR